MFFPRHCSDPFMELQDEYPQWKVMPQFAQLLLDYRDDLDSNIFGNHSVGSRKSGKKREGWDDLQRFSRVF